MQGGYAAGPASAQEALQVSPLLLLALGLLLPLALPQMAPASLAVAAGAAAVLLGLQPATRGWAWLACGLAWSACLLHVQLDNRVGQAHDQLLLSGQVSGLPVARSTYTEFRFALHQPGQLDLRPPATLLVRWQQPGQALHPGEHWQLPLRVRPPRGRINFQGPDLEAWYFAEGIAGVASVRDGPATRLERPPGSGAARLATAIDRYRDGLRSALSATLSAHPGLGLVLALAIADRSLLSAELREAMVVTGTGHLLAISGMHIGMVALLGWWLGRLCLSLAGRGSAAWPPLQLAWLGAGLCACGYAALAGLGTSTRRALVMLLVVGVCALLRRAVPAYQALLAALVVVLLLDPAAPAGAGFWLSFSAVLALIYVFAHRRPVLRGLPSLVVAQATLMLILLPLGLHWFQRLGAGGLLANLLAIPWVTLVTLPLTLLAAATAHLDGAIGEVPAFMAAESAWWTAQAVQAIAGPSGLLNWRLPSPSLPAVVLATAGALVVCGPPLAGLRWLGLLLMLPLLLPAKTPGPGGLQLDLLDVGQGLAAIVSTRQRSLLYDTGPGQPGVWDLHGSVLEPAFAGLGRKPDWVMISHTDLDHAGGAAALHKAGIGRHWLSSRPGWLDGMVACHDQRHWQWDQVRFTVLHPSPWLPYQGNNSSCVLSVQAGRHALLLPGDIDALVERRLLQQGLARHAVVVSAHHGSRSSSSPEWLHRLQPNRVLTAAGADNRFGFPHTEVTRRLERRGIEHWTTADCGALRLAMPADGPVHARSARRQRAALWRWPAAANCP